MSRLVFVAGQVARDENGSPIGPGDLAAQVAQALSNVRTAVEAAGGSFADIAKLTVYVVDWTDDKMAALGEGVTRAGVDPLRPITLLGVSRLAEPDLMVEVEAIAVLP